MTEAAPLALVEWGLVRWRSSRMARAKTCCYCPAELQLNDERIIVIDAGGNGAEFCKRCLQRHFLPKMPVRRRF